MGLSCDVLCQLRIRIKYSFKQKLYSYTCIRYITGEENEDGRTWVIIQPFKEILDILSKDAANDPRMINAILLNSWCRFPFYEADFGWGKPVWVSIASLPAGNSAVLIDTRDGDGIEAWISLDEKDMAVFQQDQDINDCVV